ncbi:hypothetical protein ACFFRR_004655 [Megaselia abdita]
MIYLIAFIIISSLQFVQPVCLGNRPIGDWHDVEVEDRTPPYSVKGGYDRTNPLFICRAFNHTISMKYVGKTSQHVQRVRYCWVDHKGSEKAFAKYQILVGVKGIWIPVFSKKDKKPCNSLRITEMNGRDIFSGRKFDHPLQTLNVGAVIDSVNHITYEGEIFLYENNYEIFAALPRQLKFRANETSKNYVTDGNFISFRVKRRHDVVMWLGPKGSQLDYEILFPFDSHRFEFTDHRLDRERILYYNDYRSNEFDSFWIYFRDNIIRVGIEGNLNFYLEIDAEEDSDISIFKFHSKGESTWHIPYFEEMSTAITTIGRNLSRRTCPPNSSLKCLTVWKILTF